MLEMNVRRHQELSWLRFTHNKCKVCFDSLQCFSTLNQPLTPIILSPSLKTQNLSTRRSMHEGLHVYSPVAAVCAVKTRQDMHSMLPPSFVQVQTRFNLHCTLDFKLKSTEVEVPSRHRTIKSKDSWHDIVNGISVVTAR